MRTFTEINANVASVARDANDRITQQYSACAAELHTLQAAPLASLASVLSNRREHLFLFENGLGVQVILFDVPEIPDGSDLEFLGGVGVTDDDAVRVQLQA